MCLGRERNASVIISPASSGVIAGKASYILVGAIIGVRTSGMWIVVNVTPSPITSEAITRVNASNAAFEATYAAKRGGVGCTPIEGIVTVGPAAPSRHARSR